MNRNFGWITTLVLVVMIVLSGCRNGDTVTEVPSTETAAPTIAPIEIVGPSEPAVCEAMPLPSLPVFPVSEDDWFKGADPAEAEVIIFEYSDFQCPGCAGVVPILNQFLADNPTVSLVYRHFPLSFHDRAMVTSEAAEAAGAQGMFWEMHDLLFVRQAEWGASTVTPEQARALMSEYAEQLGLDLAQFDRDMDEHTYEAKIQMQLLESQELMLSGTPSFIFNDVPFPSQQLGLSYAALESFYNLMSLQSRQYMEIPEGIMDTAGREGQALLRTTQGDIVIELLPEAAPTHVNSFIFLAEAGWYEGSPFFFVLEDYVALGGDPSGSSIGYPGYYCYGEMENAFDRPGLVGMLSNGQFFITLGADAAELSGQFPLIGQVVEGLDVLYALAQRSPGDPMAPEPDILLSVDIQ